MSAKALAKQIHMSQSAISQIETGSTAPDAADVERTLHSLDADEQTRSEILALARIARTSYTSVRAMAIACLHPEQEMLAALAASSRERTVVLAANPPGLMQVPDYARAVITPTVKGCPVRDVEKMLEARLATQSVLHDPERRLPSIVPYRTSGRRLFTATVWPLRAR